MRGLAFWGRMALCLPQAMAVRARAPRLPAAPGPTSGTCPALQPGSGADALRLLGIGDSIIAGVGATDSDSALVAELARHLALGLGRTVAWRALGRSGAGARVLHQVLAADDGPAADLVVVSAGVNDVIGLTPGRRWHRDLMTLADTLRRHSPGALVVLIGLPPLDRFPLLPPALARVLGGRARALDSLLAELAGQGERMLHVPIGPAVRPDLFCRDGFHPGDAGYRMLAGIVARAVFELYRADPPPPRARGRADRPGERKPG